MDIVLGVNATPDILAQSLQFQDASPGVRPLVSSQIGSKIRHQLKLFLSAERCDIPQDGLVRGGHANFTTLYHYPRSQARSDRLCGECFSSGPAALMQIRPLEACNPSQNKGKDLGRWSAL